MMNRMDPKLKRYRKREVKKGVQRNIQKTFSHQRPFPFGKNLSGKIPAPTRDFIHWLTLFRTRGKHDKNY